jgi:hypothetical protein
MDIPTFARRLTVAAAVLTTLGLASSLAAEEPRDLPQIPFTAVSGKSDETSPGDFTVPYRLARRWRTLASATDDALEERVLQTGTVLGQQLFTDVEIVGNTIFLWIPSTRPLHDPDSWSFYSDLADLMVVRCGCVEGTAAVGQDSAAPEGEKHPVQYFRFNVENGRSRIDLK